MEHRHCGVWAGMPTPSCDIRMSSYPQSNFSRFFQGWSRGMRQGTTSSESLSQSINFCLCPSFALERKDPPQGSCACPGCPVITHLLLQVTAASSFMAMQASLHAAVFFALLSAGPNLSSLYLHANSKVISIR